MPKREPDFAALRTQAMRDLVAGDATAPEYVDALEQAITQREHSALQRLLDDERPVPPWLLPVLADVIRAKTGVGKAGPPRKLLTVDEVIIARNIASRRRPMNLEDAIAAQAVAWNVGEETIRRLWRKHRRVKTA